MSAPKEYRWSLRKGGKKEVCPQCGKLRFVPYVLTDDPSVKAGVEFGRCDRENNCGYHRYPSGIDSGTEKPIIKPVPSQMKPMRFRREAVQTYEGGILFDFACSKFGEERVRRAWQMYHVGIYRGMTLFWQISKDMDLRTGKAIPYGPDGHRIKGSVPVVWLHKAADCRHLITGDELQQCLFGEHLLAHPEHEGKRVVVVESEKTALLMSIVEPRVLWLACGGSHNLNGSKGEVLVGRNVTLMPDNLMYLRWLSIAKAHGWQCSAYMEEHAPFPGADILDCFI